METIISRATGGRRPIDDSPGSSPWKRPFADSATLTCFDCLAPPFNTSAQSVGSAYGSGV